MSCYFISVFDEVLLPLPSSTYACPILSILSYSSLLLTFHFGSVESALFFLTILIDSIAVRKYKHAAVIASTAPLLILQLELTLNPLSSSDSETQYTDFFTKKIRPCKSEVNRSIQLISPHIFLLIGKHVEMHKSR